jgi:GNAT superfamily N-acetyltransferase
MKLSNITITKPNLKSFPEVFPLLRQLWMYKKLNKLRVRKVFAKGLHNTAQEFLIAKYDEKIIGFAVMTIKNSLWDEGNLCYVDVIIVDKKHRKKGIGKIILKEIIKTARKRLCKRIELDTAFFRKDAHKFYKALGFKECNLLFSKNV